MPSVTISRLDAVQRCPAWKNAPLTATDTAVGKIRIVEHDERVLAAHLELHARAGCTAAAATDGPTSCDPVKLTASTSGDAASAAPSSSPGPSPDSARPAAVRRAGRCPRASTATPGTSSAGLKTTQLPNASAGAIFHAGIASGKFHGVIAATTPSGSRVTSTSMPGRAESIFSPVTRTRFAGEELEDRAGARGLADAVGQRLALLAREQPAELVLARQDFGAGAVEDVEPLLRRRPRPLRERGARRGDGVVEIGRASRARTRRRRRSRFEGLMSVLRSAESTAPAVDEIRKRRVVMC